MKLKHFICFILLFSAFHSVAQQKDSELAEFYYNHGHFEQAEVYYKNLWKKNKSTKVYTGYLNTLIALEKKEEALAIAEKRVKRNSSNSKYILELGNLYKQFNQLENANKQYEKVIDNLQPGRSQGIRIANEFIKVTEFGYAKKTYDKSIKLGNKKYNFNYEYANLYGITGEHELMIDAFLSLLNESPNFAKTVQNSLNRVLNPIENKTNAELLRVKLLKQIQATNKPVFSEMLIWLFVQKKEFSGALIQVKALDKRLNETGNRVINLARLSSSNEDYTTARNAYQYIIEVKGKMSPFYTTSRTEIITLEKKILESKINPSKEEISALSQQFEATINELGKTSATAHLLMDWSYLEAFYLNNTNRAEEIIKNLLAIPGLYNKIEANAKIQLADIKLLQGDIWDASLLYSQVELDFKEDAIGHLAKFKNAKLYYYAGDFDWSQGLLNALKASTTKLISNDAIDLSLLITDNYAMDTIADPMQRYSRADLLQFQNRHTEALATLDSLEKTYPYHTLMDEVQFLRHEVYMKMGQIDSASICLEIIIDEHPFDILADKALFYLADIKENILHLPEEAKALYEKILFDYSASVYATEARKRYRALRGEDL